jgi:hypothetical protein
MITDQGGPGDLWQVKIRESIEESLPESVRADPASSKLGSLRGR